MKYFDVLTQMVKSYQNKNYGVQVVSVIFQN